MIDTVAEIGICFFQIGFKVIKNRLGSLVVVHGFCFILICTVAERSTSKAERNRILKESQ